MYYIVKNQIFTKTKSVKKNAKIGIKHIKKKCTFARKILLKNQRLKIINYEKNVHF